MTTLSIIIPVFNEEKTISSILGRVKLAPCLGLTKEIIVIDDGSTDKTPIILKKYKKSSFQIITLKKNMGKGYALRKGLEVCTGDFILIQDADLEYNPKEYPKILTPLVNQEAEIVYGVRGIEMFFPRKANQLTSFFFSKAVGRTVHDVETCYKAFTKKYANQILPGLTQNGFGFEIESSFLLLHKSKQEIFREVSISYSPRTYIEDKKITWEDGFEAFYLIVLFFFRHISKRTLFFSFTVLIVLFFWLVSVVPFYAKTNDYQPIIARPGVSFYGERQLYLKNIAK